MLIGDLNMSFPSPKNARTGCHNHPVPLRQESASSRAVGEYLRVSRMREPAESWLAANQAFLGRRFFIFDRIAPARRNCQQRQPVAFGISIDRDGNTRRAVHRARQSANGAGEQTAQDRSCDKILHPYSPLRLLIHQTNSGTPYVFLPTKNSHQIKVLGTAI
jgi:hypothetical protein